MSHEVEAGKVANSMVCSPKLVVINPLIKEPQLEGQLL